MRKAVIFSLVINIIFTLNHYSYINSTKTAALLVTAGFLLVLNAIRNKRYSFSCWVGVLEIILGSFFNIVYLFSNLDNIDRSVANDLFQIFGVTPGANDVALYIVELRIPNKPLKDH